MAASASPHWASGGGGQSRDNGRPGSARIGAGHQYSGHDLAAVPSSREAGRLNQIIEPCRGKAELRVAWRPVADQCCRRC